jgi:hypothetical protein
LVLYHERLEKSRCVDEFPQEQAGTKKPRRYLDASKAAVSTMVGGKGAVGFIDSSTVDRIGNFQMNSKWKVNEKSSLSYDRSHGNTYITRIKVGLLSNRFSNIFDRIRQRQAQPNL